MKEYKKEADRLKAETFKRRREWLAGLFRRTAFLEVFYREHKDCRDVNVDPMAVLAELDRLTKEYKGIRHAVKNGS